MNCAAPMTKKKKLRKGEDSQQKRWALQALERNTPTMTRNLYKASLVYTYGCTSDQSREDDWLPWVCPNAQPARGAGLSQQEKHSSQWVPNSRGHPSHRAGLLNPELLAPPSAFQVPFARSCWRWATLGSRWSRHPTFNTPWKPATGLPRASLCLVFGTSTISLPASNLPGRNRTQRSASKPRGSRSQLCHRFLALCKNALTLRVRKPVGNALKFLRQPVGGNRRGKSELWSEHFLYSHIV